MTNGYNPDLGEFDCTQIDVLLAEYVDGTMDPVVRSAFEEWMQSDPSVADRVMSLQGVRRELCRLGCRCAAPAGFEQRLHSRLAVEDMQASLSGLRDVTTPLRLAAALATLVVVLLAGGVALTQTGSLEEAAVETASNDFVPDLQRERSSSRRVPRLVDGRVPVGLGVMPVGYVSNAYRSPFATYSTRFQAWSTATVLDSASHRRFASEAVAFP